jgi:hypothetical protein
MGSEPANGSKQERREKRRQGLVFGRVSSFEMLAEADLDFWRRATLEEKFQATIELVRDSWHLEGRHGPVPRLDRRVGGVRKLRG